MGAVDVGVESFQLAKECVDVAVRIHRVFVALAGAVGFPSYAMVVVNPAGVVVAVAGLAEPS